MKQGHQIFQEKSYDDLYLEIERKQGKLPMEVLYLPRPASDYRGCYPLHFEKHVERLLGTTNYVHFFAGKATTGYRIDLNKNLNVDKIADVQDLSDILDNSFDGGMADPPYDKEFANTLYDCDYPEFTLWTKELVRIVKPGGRIGIMQNYIVPRLPGCEYEKLVIIFLRVKQFPKIVTIQRKLPITKLNEGDA